jgi:hypothetical protein
LIYKINTISRTTAVFAFESALKEHKRWNDQHKNGKSEGSSMLQNFWAEVTADTLIAVNGQPSHLQKPLKKKKCVLKYSTGEYIFSHNTIHVCMISAVNFHNTLLYYTFQKCDISKD